MGEMASLWAYAEHNEMDQLGQKLLYTTLELEKLKSETMEEMRKNKEYVNQLITLLKCAVQERDEAKNQLGNLINQTLMPNSSISESSNSLSPVSSPDFSNIDQGSLIIECLVKGRVLPEKGMFLQAVLEAGPLLQTLLLAGPLPTWRNPPRLQPFQIPPVSIKGGDAAQKPVGLRHIMTSTSHSNYGNFGNVVSGSGSCFNGGSMVVDGDNGCLRFAKRHRFC